MKHELIWNSREADDYAKARVRTAQVQSDLATARLQGMKARAKDNPPTAAKGGFPYPARTCAEWTRYEAWQARRRG